MLWSGLFQSWDTFAPEPKSVNSYIEALVVFKDGSTSTWKFPRMEQLSLTERYYRERYRKFVEVLQQSSHSALWPDISRYIARLNNKHASNPPEIVILVEHRSAIGPYTEGPYRPEPSHARIFFEYNVKPEDLK